MVEQGSGWVPLILGVAVIIAGVVQAAKYIAFVRRGQNVPGVVAGLRGKPGAAEGVPSYQPTLHFVTLDGREVRTKMRVASFPAPAKPGERVTIVYDPRDPSNAEIKNKGWLFLVVLVLAFFVLGFALLGVGWALL